MPASPALSAPPHETDGELIRAGLNLIQQALTIYDRDLRLAVCNARFGEMFDLPRHLTTPGAGFAETIRYLAERGEYGPLDDIDAFVAERVEQARAFVPHYMERRRANGRTISVEGSPLRRGGWVAVYTDITAIKRQEELLRSHSAQLSDQLLTHSEELARTNRELAATIAALEEAKRDLTAAEERARVTAEMIPAHIARIDRDGRYTYSNRKLPTILPGRPSDIIGMPAEQALGPELFAILAPRLQAALAGEPAVFEVTDPDSGRRLRVALTPDQQGSGGQVRGAYVLSMDITEEAQARAALMQTRKRELAAQLTSGLAHDFSNLLTIILGLQGQLAKLPDLPDRARELIATTRAAAMRGGVLLDRLSQVAGRRELKPVATDLPGLLADIRAMAAPLLPEGVALDCDCGRLDAPVMIDSGYLQDSLLNLILNARDALGDGPGRIAVALHPRGGQWLEITVSDTGPGFTPEALEQALDPFYTTKRDGAGSGLGLSTVYDFAQLSGGQVKIANAPEGGARVTLRLPLRKAPRAQAPAPAERLVLLVEDDTDLRATLREMLCDLGHAVIEAASADEAEALAALPGVTLVLSDITLEGERTGLDLARALAEGGGPRVALMTSLPPGNALRDAAEAAFPLIAKPFSAEALADLLSREAAR